MVPFPEVTCKRCGYGWEPRIAAPKQCPQCRSFKWREPRSEKYTFPGPVSTSSINGVPEGVFGHREYTGISRENLKYEPVEE